MDWGRAAELAEAICQIVFEKGNIFKLDLDCLFCVVALSFFCVFANTKQVVESNQGQVSNGLVQLVGRWEMPDIQQELWGIRFNRELLYSWWAYFFPSIKHLGNVLE